MACKCCESSKNEDVVVCPVCRKVGDNVSTETVKSLVNEDIELKDTKYHICKDHKCEVIYFSNNQVIVDSEVKVEVWYKEKSTPKVLCYCSNITTYDIDSAFQQNNELTFNDVIKDMKNEGDSDCLHNNPTGKCCHKVISQYIENLKQVIIRDGSY